MCSVNECACEAVGVDRATTRRIESSTIRLETQKICKKCRSAEAQVTLSISDGGYCKNCFLTRTSHKFRATLGKSKVIRKDDAVLVLYDGSPSSAALLHLIKSAQNESARKRLLMEPIVLYIDAHSSVEQPVAQRRVSMRSAIEQIQKLNFVGYTTFLASFSAKIVPLYAIGDIYEPSRDGLDKSLTFSHLTDSSAKEDLVTIQYRRTIVTAARQLNCNKVLLPDTSMDIAVKLLSDLALGRGGQLSFDVDFVDARYADVLFLRPMKDFSTEEVMNYLSFCDNPLASNVDSLKESNMVLNSETTLQAITKGFVNKLNNEFSDTVSTIFRTGGKLCSEDRKESTETGNTCVLCDGNLDPGMSHTTVDDDKLFSIRATDFSKVISSDVKNNGYNDDIGIVDRIFDSIEACSVPISANNLSQKSIRKALCYGCRLIAIDFDDCLDMSSLMLHLN